MPFDSVRDLKTSALYNRMDTLQTMSDTKLDRFVSVFNSVFNRVRRNGGTEDEAESTAVPLALSAARRASIVNQRVEDEVHFVAAHMPEQMAGGPRGFTGDEYDFRIVKEMPDMVNDAVAGNLFTHGHGGPAVGVIRGIVLRDDAPDEVKERTDPDAPFLYRASYFEDTAEAVREMKGVSAEWASIPLDNGKRLAMPGTFVVTDHPLNPPYTGIRMVAGHTDEDTDTFSIPSANLRRIYSDHAGMDEPMTEGTGIEDLSPEELAGKLEETQAALKELKEEKQEQEGRFEEVKAGLERLASLEKALGKEPDAEDSVEERIASLEDSLTEAVNGKKEAEERIAALEEKQAKRDAKAWAEENLAGRIPTDEWASWINRHMADPEGTEELVATLPKGLLGDDDAKAESITEEDTAALDEALDEVLGTGADSGTKEVRA